MSFDPAASGWKPVAETGFSALVGPMWTRREEAGRAFGFIAEPKHVNHHGVVHGGMLMTFADHALGSVVWQAAERKPSVTIQLTTHFVAPVRPGDFVEARGEVVRRTRAMVFVRGTLTVGPHTVISVDGIWKVLGEA